MEMHHVGTLELWQRRDVGAETAVVHCEKAAARETVVAENLQTLGHELQLHSPLVWERNDARIIGLLVAHKQFGLNPVSVERPQKPVGSHGGSANRF